jgi:hypothetical protein
MNPGQTNSPVEVVIEEVEIEVFVVEGRAIPHARRYVIRVDREKITVHQHEITGRRILELVGKTPEKFKLYEHRHGQQPKQVHPDQIVDLKVHRVERFTTLPKGTTDGRADAPVRREFSLPADDVRYLDGLGLEWETVKDGTGIWLVIHKWFVPDGYAQMDASVAIMIPPCYPDAALDMVYFHPHLSLKSGKAINQLSTQMICGRVWQRWSRHFTPENPWRMGVDDVSTYLGLIDNWLRREISGE